MRKAFWGFGIITLLLCIFVSACNKEDGDSSNDNFDRKALLTNYTDNYIIPAYGDMVQKMTDLKAKKDHFIANPDETNFASLQNSWKQAYLTWQKVEMLEIGPAEDVSLRMFINIYPVSVSKVNSNISTGTYDLDAFGNKDAQGFPALDFLMNGLGATNADILTYYTSDPQSVNRKKYLSDVVNQMNEMIAGVKAVWTSYRSQFIESTGTDVNSSLTTLANSYILYYERYLRAGKIGLPVGAMSGIAAPELTEAYYSPNLSLQLAIESMKAVGRFYNGQSYTGNTDGTGLNDYLAAIGTKDENGKLMADLISDELNEAEASLQSLNGTIKDAVINNRPAVLAIYDQIQEVVPLLKVDMVSAFGISITYVDNDGD